MLWIPVDITGPSLSYGPIPDFNDHCNIQPQVASNDKFTPGMCAAQGLPFSLISVLYHLYLYLYHLYHQPVNDAQCQQMPFHSPKIHEQ